MKRITSIVAIASAVFVLGGKLAARQALAQKICPPCAAVQSVQSGLDTLPPGALGNKQWALGPEGVDVPWKPLDESSGRPLPGTGATVVQIDTGVTSHPLLAGSLVDVHAADDLYGPGHRNVDLLLGGFLRFPGHGTKTASVIVARPDNANVSTGILGVAPGVRLIPVRGTEGVVLFGRQLGQLNADQHRIARALNEAAKHGKGLFNAQVDVISMSLGGWPPTSDLCVAVENATKEGIIVIVAAGNEVRRATYPARCKTAIAVAGSTFNQEPWSGSAGAEEVAIAAPAEGVWTASVMNGMPCIEASSGTSFATALVAGLAAEWSVRNPRNEATKALRHDAFREALQKSARPWKTESWKTRFGRGIVDATKLF